MPELSDALHGLFEAEARVQVHPSRAMNELTGEARSARRRAQVRSGLVGVAGAVAVGALVVGGIRLFGEPTPPAANPTPTATAAPTAVWNPQAAAQTALAGFTLPQCGDDWAPSPTDVGPVGVAITASFAPGEDGGVQDMIYTDGRFVADEGTTIDVLGTTSAIVATLDGKVVWTADPGDLAWIDLYRTNVGTASAGTLQGQFSCETKAKIAAYNAEHGWTEDAEHTQAENDAHSDAIRKITNAAAKIPTGDYTIYAISPVVAGVDAAIAKDMKGEGLTSVAGVREDIGNSPWGNDPRLSIYCKPNGDDGQGNESWWCNAPDDVLDEVLTFEYDPANVVDLTPGVAISAPVTVTVP